MKKWEYATLEIAKALLSSGTVCLPDGQTQNFSANLVSATQVLNSMGRDGWEVVACGGSATTALWTLRREIGN